MFPFISLSVNSGMQIVKLLSCFCVLLLYSNTSFAQGETKADPLCKNEDILILKEKDSYTFTGVKAYFLNLIVDKEVEYKILNNQGVEKLKVFVLPELIDETYFVHAPDIRNISYLPENSLLLSFSGEVVKPNGTQVKINPDPRLAGIKTLNDKGFFGTLNTFKFDIPGLNTGDIVRIRYKISIPFRDNIYSLMVSRFFFHHSYPVKSLDFSFSYNQALLADTAFYNGCRVDPTLCGENLCFQWHFDNLPGCLDEAGSRPYLDLPWFSFHPKMNETLEYDYDSYNAEFVAPWYLMTGHREGKFEYYTKEAEQGIRNQDNSGFDKIALRFNNAKNDSVNRLNLWRFQKWMADSTLYHPDTSYYLMNEMQLISKPGVDLAGGIIRDHTKDEIYAAMIHRLGYGYVNAYLMDKRIGAVSSRYFASMHDNDVLFAIPLAENIISYVIPPSDRNHYYFEELPFYYEDTPAIIIHYSDFKGYKRNYYDSLRVVNTPGSAYSENVRNTSCAAAVNTDKLDITFSGKTNISGQYSTLTRSIYLGKLPDNKINPCYSHKFWEIGGLVKPAVFSIVNNDYVFPYKTTISGVYQSSALRKTGDSTFEIDISDWFRHVTYPGLSSGNRVTDFYPDFQGSDKYFYMLSFDKNIELLDIPAKINIENKLGSYVFNIQQTAKDKVLITSFYITKGKVIRAVDIADVVSIYEAIKSNSKFKLGFRVVP